jgi:hypothetical protein
MGMACRTTIAMLVATLVLVAPLRTAAAATGTARFDLVEGGRHLRLESQNGVVHVWMPPDFDPATAGTVVYLHGHGSSADDSWTTFALASQFKASWLNAMFIVPDSTADGEEPLHWESLGALLHFVGHAVGRPPLPGPLVVVGHSGAYRNIGAWLSDLSVDELVLLDALYDYEPAFRAWLEHPAPGKVRRLTLVSRETRRRGAAFVAAWDGAQSIDGVPEQVIDLPGPARNAQVLELVSQFSHMAIVNSGKVIPMVLRRSTVALVASAPLEHTSNVAARAQPPARGKKRAVRPPARKKAKK